MTLRPEGHDGPSWGTDPHCLRSHVLTLLNWPGKWLDGGGGWGHRSRGTKMLYVAEEAGKPKIIAETFTQLMW